MTTGERMKARRKELGLSAEDVADKLGKSPATIYRYEKGEIEKLPGDILTPLAEILHTTPAYLMGWEVRDARTIPSGYEPLPTTVKRPLIGDIACGEPITAAQNVRDYVDVPDDVECDFCLRVHGDSMIDAHIQDGDLVYIRIQPDVEDGEIAAVRIGDEATLKRVYRDTDSITLIPANASYRPRTYTGPALDDIQIEGKMVGFTHWCG
jgi:repressor LexA